MDTKEIMELINTVQVSTDGLLRRQLTAHMQNAIKIIGETDLLSNGKVMPRTVLNVTFRNVLVQTIGAAGNGTIDEKGYQLLCALFFLADMDIISRTDANTLLAELNDTDEKENFNYFIGVLGIYGLYDERHGYRNTKHFVEMVAQIFAWLSGKLTGDKISFLSTVATLAEDAAEFGHMIYE